VVRYWAKTAKPIVEASKTATSQYGMTTFPILKDFARILDSFSPLDICIAPSLDTLHDEVDKSFVKTFLSFSEIKAHSARSTRQESPQTTRKEGFIEFKDEVLKIGKNFSRDHFERGIVLRKKLAMSPIRNRKVTRIPSQTTYKITLYTRQ
jgi:hypothetical protein